jgi:hypothetical protein
MSQALPMPEQLPLVLDAFPTMDQSSSPPPVAKTRNQRKDARPSSTEEVAVTLEGGRSRKPMCGRPAGPPVTPAQRARRG